MDVVIKAHHGLRILSNENHNCSIEFIISSHHPIHFFLQIYNTEASAMKICEANKSCPLPDTKLQETSTLDPSLPLQPSVQRVDIYYSS